MRVVILSFFLNLGCKPTCESEPAEDYEKGDRVIVADLGDWVDVQGNLTNSCENYCDNVPADFVVGCRLNEILRLDEAGYGGEFADLYDEQEGEAGAGHEGEELSGPGVIRVVCEIHYPGTDCY